ncbi:MAG: hydrogenase 3 maturation endopeptidase HyCI [Candidatus Omnitrophica bacterium]|nr:hydrogenase 3 maturation endopeptidase HyCI [Candidatus Omnitrophota bacterium]
MINLKDVLKGKVVILCIGNIERGDDGLGPYLAGMIKGRVPYEVIDAGAAPENWTGVITRLKPDTIVMVDAIYFEGEPGEIRIFSGEDLRSGKISTHDVSPKLLIEYLKESTKADIYVLGIKPEANRFGEGLSKSVRNSLEELERCLLKESQ